MPYLYLGYLAKKNRWLDKPLPRRTLYILLGGTALTAVGALLAQSTDCISMGEWTLGPLSILLDASHRLFVQPPVHAAQPASPAPSHRAAGHRPATR